MRSNAKLTPVQREAILDSYIIDDVSTIELGKRYNVHWTTIGNVLKRNGIVSRKAQAVKHTRYPDSVLRDMDDDYFLGKDENYIKKKYGLDNSLVVCLLSRR